MTTHLYQDIESVVANFAAYISEEVAKNPIFHIALSGGNTPKVLFDHLVQHYSEKIDWTKVHLYWGDERCVPPEDEQSNYRMTQERLISKIPIPSKNIHRILGEAPPPLEANRYHDYLNTQLPINSDGRPVFDLMILGMGGDGHTASIFPHQMELLSAESNCAVATHPESGQLRISLTGAVIQAAKRIHFLVIGASKKEVGQKILLQQENYLDYPAAHIANAVWWLDEAAGDFLS